MKITTISYYRKKNLGNYETEDISLTAELDENELVADAMDKLKYEAREALFIPHPISPSAEPKLTNFDEKPF